MREKQHTLYSGICALSLGLVLFAGACTASENGSPWSGVGGQIKEAAAAVGDATATSAKEGWEATKEYSQRGWEATKEYSTETWERVKNASPETTRETGAATENALDEAN